MNETENVETRKSDTLGMVDHPPRATRRAVHRAAHSVGSEVRVLGINHRLLPLMAALAVIALSFAGLGTAIAVVRKDVNLNIDGKAQKVVSWESNVDAILQENGIILGRRDRVQPSMQSTIASGDTISVRSARQLGYTVDGQAQQTWTTQPSVADALAELKLTDQAVTLNYVQGTSRHGEELPLVSKKTTLLIRHDGTENNVGATKKDTVETTLEKAGVKVNDPDRVTTVFNPGAAPEITVVRVQTQEIVDKQTIPFTEEKTVDPNKFSDEKIETRKGENGEKTITRRVTTEDGQEVSSEVIKEEVTKQPVSRQLTVGSKQRPIPVAAPIAAGGPESAPGTPAAAGGAAPAGVWASLAQCESGGNPASVSSNGLYHGLYQFSVGTWRSVGGSGLPSQASAAEQTMRAQMLQARSGWGQWPACSRRLGLR